MLKTRLFKLAVLATLSLPATSCASTPLVATDVESKPYPGVTYILRKLKDPKIIHIVTVNLSSPFVSLHVSPENERALTPSEFAKRNRTQIAINGDFFTPEFRPLGLSVARGVSWKRSRDTARYSFLACDARNHCEIDVSNSARETKKDWNSVIGGREVLLKKDFVWSAADDARCGSFCTTPHPRTALGLNRDKTKLFLVVVEGRQPPLEGVTLNSLALILKGLGAEEGINLDGGGSSQLVIDGKLVSGRPANETGERPVANCLGIRVIQ